MAQWVHVQIIPAGTILSRGKSPLPMIGHPHWPEDVEDGRMWRMGGCGISGKVLADWIIPK